MPTREKIGNGRMSPVSDEALAILFRDARSHNGWLDKPVDERLLKLAYDIARWGPTSMNTQPMRLLFLRSPTAKRRIVPALADNNVDKLLTAPVVAVIAHDTKFYRHLPRTFPHYQGAENYFEGDIALADSTAFRNSSLQAGYFMLALRAVGLDIGPISGFDAAAVDREFFRDMTWQVNLLCGLGYGDHAKVLDRLPRLEFHEIGKIL